MRSKKEIIDRICLLENEYRIEQQKRYEYEWRWENPPESSDIFMQELRRETKTLDWVLNIR